MAISVGVGLLISAIATAASGAAQAGATSKAGAEAEQMANELAGADAETQRQNMYLQGRQVEGARAIGMKQIEYNKAKEERAFMANQSQSAWERWRTTANQFSSMLNNDQTLKSNIINRVAARAQRKAAAI